MGGSAVLDLAERDERWWKVRTAVRERVTGSSAIEFVLRDADDSDVDRCLALTTDRFLYDEVYLAALRRMWLDIVSTKSGSFPVIADARSPSHIVHFAVQVFVADERADAYHRLASPKLAYRLVEDFEAGLRPYLDRNEIARANAGGRVNLVVTHHGYEAPNQDEDRERLRAASYESTRRHFFGWNLRTYTNEVYSHDSLRDGKEMGEALGFRPRQYSDEQLLAADIPADKAPWVWLAARQDVIASPAGLTQALLFSSFSPPRFGFSFAEQDTLLLALDGHTDEAIAETTGASLSTIKKRFRTIYAKVQDASTDEEAVIFSEALVPGARGVETRRRILNYLRDHRQELRPYLAPS
jgi:DNA-binding CsgD family transcriptional regulator